MGRHQDDIRDDIFESAPICFSCGKEMGVDPEVVMYLGYGRRAEGEGPAWVATVCCCEGSHGEGRSPCVEKARAFAEEEGAPMTPAQYSRWLATA